MGRRPRGYATADHSLFFFSDFFLIKDVLLFFPTFPRHYSTWMRESKREREWERKKALWNDALFFVCFLYEKCATLLLTNFEIKKNRCFSITSVLLCVIEWFCGECVYTFHHRGQGIRLRRCATIWNTQTAYVVPGKLSAGYCCRMFISRILYSPMGIRQDLKWNGALRALRSGRCW